MKYISYQNNMYRIEKEIGDELEIIQIHVASGIQGLIYYPDKKSKTISRFDDYSVEDEDFDELITEYSTKSDA